MQFKKQIKTTISKNKTKHGIKTKEIGEEQVGR